MEGVKLHLIVDMDAQFEQGSGETSRVDSIAAFAVFPFCGHQVHTCQGPKV